MRTSIAILISLLLLAACGGNGDDGGGGATARAKPVVAAVNYPLAYFAERLADGAVEVVFPVPAGEDPAWWQPDDDQVRMFQQADRILANGATYAKWMEKVSLPPRKIVDTSRRVADRTIPIEETVTHAHGPEGAHAHGGTAFTTWLDADFAVAQANAVAEALAKLAPDAASGIETRRKALEQDLRALATELEAVVQRAPDRPVFFSHPVYQYLASSLGMNGRSVHWEPDVMPGKIQWRKFETLREGHAAQWMIWEASPRDSLEKRLEGAGIRSVVFRPLGNRPPDGDYFTAMKANVRALEEVYGE